MSNIELTDLGIELFGEGVWQLVKQLNLFEHLLFVSYIYL